MQYTAENPDNLSGANDGAPIVPTAELVADLTSQLDQLQEKLNATIEEHRAQRGRLEDGLRIRQEQLTIAERNREHLTRQVDRMAGTLGEVDQATSLDEFYRFTLKKALTIGKMLGHITEARTIAHALDEGEIWQEIVNDESLELADSEELTKWRAIRQVVERQGWSYSGKHPSAPEYRDLWRKAVRVAMDEGYCDVFQQVAGYVGIPTNYDFTYSGTVRVYVEGWFEVDVEGETYNGQQPDPYEEVDYDIRDHLDELDVTMEWTSYSVED